MLKNKKLLLEIEKEIKKLEQEKQELQVIKQYLEDKTPKIDISNIYIWECRGIYNLVEMKTQEVTGENFFGKIESGYESTLTDIFSHNILYKKTSVKLIEEEEIITTYKDIIYGYLYSLYEVDKNLMIYADKKVPLYVLQQLYYKLNNVDTNCYTLKKENK